jgi:hypothetical protein
VKASGFSAPGAVGGLPEERGGAAEEVATGSGTNSGSSAPAPAQFHLGEVKVFWIHNFRQRGTPPLFIGDRYPSGTVKLIIFSTNSALRIFVLMSVSSFNFDLCSTSLFLVRYRIGTFVFVSVPQFFLNPVSRFVSVPHFFYIGTSNFLESGTSLLYRYPLI